MSDFKLYLDTETNICESQAEHLLQCCLVMLSHTAATIIILFLNMHFGVMHVLNPSFQCMLIIVHIFLILVSKCIQGCKLV